MENQKNLQRQKFLEISQTKRQIFTSVLHSSLIKEIPKRDLDVLKSRYQDIPIGQLGNDWFLPTGDGRNRWKDKILIWNAMIGIRDVLPDPAQETMLLDFLINEYGGLTFSEIELAFRMNMLGEFGTVIEHYNLFNVRYLTQIINAYKTKRIEADLKYKEICHRLQYLPPPTDDQRLIDYQCGKNCYLKYRQWLKGEPVIGLYFDYRFLLRIGVIQEDTAEMQEAMSMVQGDFEREFDQSLKGIGEVLLSDGMFTKSMDDRAKSIVVINLFEKLKMDGADFQTILRTHINERHREGTGGTE